MKILALHKNGYLYNYDSTEKNDIDLWFEGRSIDDIVEAFNTDARDNSSGYTSAGMKIKLEYADGVMDGSMDILEKTTPIVNPSSNML